MQWVNCELRLKPHLAIRCSPSDFNAIAQPSLSHKVIVQMKLYTEYLYFAWSS